jgi:ATP-dependent protease ClpP protease subunit
LQPVKLDPAGGLAKTMITKLNQGVLMIRLSSTGAAASLAFVLVGCASTGVVPADRGTYMISKQSAAGVFGTPDGVRADIYVEANEFCSRTGNAVETVSVEAKQAIPFVRTGSALLYFKCVPK